MTTTLYPEQDHPALGDFYIRHVMAMTTEGLHAKSDIAAQLAWRDAEIARLQAQAQEDVQRRVDLAAALDSKDAEIRHLRSTVLSVAEHRDQLFADKTRLQAQLAESRQQTDALFNTGMSYCDKIEALQAQVDALADALERAKRTMADYGQCDNDNWPYFQAVCAALAAVGR